MKRTLLAAALAATVAIAAVPLLARSAEDGDLLLAQAGPMSADSGDHGMPGRDRAGMRGWPTMRRMMQQNPQERCTDRLAWRAAMRAYAEAKLDLAAVRPGPRGGAGPHQHNGRADACLRTPSLQTCERSRPGQTSDPRHPSGTSATGSLRSARWRWRE